MPRTEALKKAQAKYKKESTVIVNIRLHKELDADIIDRLNEVHSKQGYIKDLVRADIKKDEMPEENNK